MVIESTLQADGKTLVMNYATGSQWALVNELSPVLGSRWEALQS